MSGNREKTIYPLLTEDYVNDYIASMDDLDPDDELSGDEYDSLLDKVLEATHDGSLRNLVHEALIEEHDSIDRVLDIVDSCLDSWLKRQVGALRAS